MLIGTYQHNIDLKGRVIIPAKFREELGGVFYATKGLDTANVTIYSEKDWEELGRKIASFPASKTAVLQRVLFSPAAMLEPDKQGRVLLPQNLREYAGLDKDVVVNGVGSKVEIWDKDKWDEYERELPANEAFEILGELGI